MSGGYTYTMLHPQLSSPLIMDAEIARSDRALIAWATMYILRNFDEMVSWDGWLISEVGPEDLSGVAAM